MSDETPAEWLKRLNSPNISLERNDDIKEFEAAAAYQAKLFQDKINRQGAELAKSLIALDEQVGQWIKAKDEANTLRVERDEYKFKGEILCCDLGNKMMELSIVKVERDRYREALKLMVNGDKDGDFITYYEREVGDKTMPTYFDVASEALQDPKKESK